MKQEKDEIDKSFENFLKEAPEKPIVNPKLIQHILEMRVMNLQKINLFYWAPFQTITSMATHH